MKLAAIGLVCAAVPAALFLRNLGAYRRAPHPTRRDDGVSVLIPARNEERGIGAAVASALQNEGITLEVIVLDDHSTDDTAFIVEAIASADSRVRLVHGDPLPDGWCGKQHACSQLARQARYPLLCFMDADVFLEEDALARMAEFLSSANAHLVSGVPRQEAGTFLERLLIPLIHFVLLGFLPVRWMRRTTHPSFSAGCGQLFLARADAYTSAGGHAAIRATLHDGINLPRAFRRAGLKTDIFDATDIASCRMYSTASEVWRGLRKNATEGLGAPGRIVPFTLMLTLGQVAPLVLVFATQGQARKMWAAALALAYLPRLLGMGRFEQPMLGAALHPLGVLLLLAIQWQALVMKITGATAEWKGRAYASRQSL
jgi:hypothetical protein